MDAMENMFLQLRTAGNPGAMRFAEEFCYSHGDEVRDLNLFLNEVEKCQSDDFRPSRCRPTAYIWFGTTVAVKIATE